MTTLTLDDIVDNLTAHLSERNPALFPFSSSEADWPAVGCPIDPEVYGVTKDLSSGQPVPHPGHKEDDIVLQPTSDLHAE